MNWNLARIQSFIPGISTGLASLITAPLVVALIKRFSERDFSFFPDGLYFLLVWLPSVVLLYLFFRFLIGVVIRRFLKDKLEDEKISVLEKAFNDTYDGKFKFPIESNGTLISDEAVRWANREMSIRKKSDFNKG